MTSGKVAEIAVNARKEVVRSANTADLGQNTLKLGTSRACASETPRKSHEFLAALLRLGLPPHAGGHQLAVDGTLHAWRCEEPSRRQVFYWIQRYLAGECARSRPTWL